MPTSTRKTSRIPTTAAQTAHTDNHPPFAYTPDEGKKALAALLPTLMAIPEAEVDVIRIDVEAAAYAALGVARFVQSADARPRFAELPKRAFDMAAADGLERACLALLFAHTEAQVAGALESDKLIPQPIAAEATEVEGRMQTVCEYQLWDDPEIAPELDRLRPGVGYRDLLNDLKGYIRIYELRADVVKRDSKNYRASDLKRAKELVAILGAAFSDGMSPRASETYTTYVRCWTLLQRLYSEVQQTGLWLFRKEPLGDRRFPSLFAVARPNVGRPRKRPAPGADPAATPAAAPPVTSDAGSSSSPAAGPTGQ